MRFGRRLFERSCGYWHCGRFNGWLEDIICSEFAMITSLVVFIVISYGAVKLLPQPGLTNPVVLRPRLRDTEPLGTRAGFRVAFNASAGTATVDADASKRPDFPPPQVKVVIAYVLCQ